MLSQADLANPSDEALAILSDGSYDAAGEALNDYAIEACGINLDG